MKESLKLGGILFLITGICVGLLGIVNQMTLPIIETNNLKLEQESMKQLISEADHFLQVNMVSDGIIKKVFVAQSSSDIVGYIVNVEPKGYGGNIGLLVGIDHNNMIKGVKILSHSETPGFGANADKPDFINQYINKQGTLKVTKIAPKVDEIQAITGATITSAAITEGVNAAADYTKNHQDEWGDMQ